MTQPSTSATPSSGPRPDEARIEPLALDELDDEVAAVVENGLSRDGVPLNIFGVLAHHPRLLKRFNLMGGLLLNGGRLPAREREIVVLRVGWNAQARYEFGQHTIIGREAGLTDDEITSLTRDDGDWSDDDRTLIAMADELHADDCVSSATWQRLASRWDQAELVELLVLAGFYRLVSGFLNSAGVQLDDGVPGFPTP